MNYSNGKIIIHFSPHPAGLRLNTDANHADYLGFSKQHGILKDTFGSHILCTTGQFGLGSKMLAPHDRGLITFLDMVN